MMEYRRAHSNSSSDGPASPKSPTTPPSPGGSPTGVEHETMMSLCRSIIPPLSHSRHKGEAGQIGFLGGCEEYTGAPYFAAMSALRAGGDLAHIFCTVSAATAIKSYSPELIVHPLLDRLNSAEEVSKWLPRMHTLVIGPGLGREEQNISTTKTIISKAKRMCIPIIIDANGIGIIIEDPTIIKGYNRAILTPNVAEFSRLYQQLMGKAPEEGNDAAATIEVSKALGNVTIVRKGYRDIICSGDKLVVCEVEGSPRRCGGQGDLLAGSMGTFLHWASVAFKTTESYLLKTQGPNITAAYMACVLTRECNRRSFQKHQRATITTNMLEEIGPAFRVLYEPRHK